MILTIGGKEYTLKFGLGFLKTMNEMHAATIEGMNTKYGAMTLLNVGVGLNDPMAFVDIIKAGTAEAPQKPSDNAIEDYIIELAKNRKYQEVVTEVMDELKKSPLLTLAMNVQ